jgi:hypothetical protein
VFVVVRLTIKAQTVALKAPSTGFAVSMVVTLTDVVARPADAVDVAIDCAAAERASMVDFNRMVFRWSRCIGENMSPRQGRTLGPFYLKPR